MQNFNLTNLSVLVTRPDPAGTELCEHIEKQGGKAIHFPTITFENVDQETFQQSIETLGNQDWLIFISPQSVYASIPTIRRQWPHFPPHVKLAAIGEGTAKALQAAGYQVSAIPTEEWNSEGLLSLPIFQSIKNKKIMLVKGEGGRELLANILTDRGAIVTYAIAYRRTMPTTQIKDYFLLLKDSKIDAIVCASYESVKNLKRMFGEDAWEYLKNVPLVIIGQRIKTLANDLGFQTIWVAQDASHISVMETLENIKEGKPNV